MFAKLFIVALAIAAVAARPGVPIAATYASPYVSAIGAPAVVATRSTYHGIGAPAIAYSNYAAPAAVSAYSSPLATYSHGLPAVSTYSAGVPVAYSSLGVSPYTVY
ncbi:larval/pupal cuticle protein H1C-like [Toxorhynchites rutilus septentrionalis]|uniref:larval/pupal cuticle protein H1C-like n=1 Tax=Toxorhynchites rutilus septentrionalis TaxID=329112 RepID=UPI002478AE66|nr:larval/pupal cuticle protein H1C-like [Toxorhynchites rutilus septentrionalis]